MKFRLELCYRDSKNQMTHFSVEVDSDVYKDVEFLEAGQEIEMGTYNTPSKKDFFNSDIHPDKYYPGVDGNLFEITEVISIQEPNKEPYPSKDYKVAKAIIHQMDFKLLKAQKTILSNLMDSEKISKAENSALEGILNLIDSIQDLAIDEYGYDRKEVLNLSVSSTSEVLSLPLDMANQLVMAENATIVF